MDCTHVDATEAKPHSEPGRFLRDHRGLSTLFIDDDKFTRDLFRKIMVAYGMPDVATSDCADDALRRINENYYDLVITDIVMKGATGIQLAKEIRRKASLAGTKASVPIIMLTAHTEERLVRACAELGANGYLVKPLVPAKLMRLIARLCNSTQPELVSHTGN